MDNSKITERFQNLNCSESEKNRLHDYLFTCLAKGKIYELKRQRVMIMEENDENKFVVLEKVTTANENQIYFSCPKCFPRTYTEFLSPTLSIENFKTCIHKKIS